MKSIITFVILFTLLQCAGNSSQENRNSGSHSAIKTTLDSVDFEVIRFDAKYSYLFSETVQATEVSREEIVGCEDLLKSYIADYNEEAYYKIDLKKYGRQYIPVLTGKGEKIIYVNFFCDPESFDYRSSELVQVDDGGNCYFQCWIDLTSKKVFQFAENGIANASIQNNRLMASKL